MTLDDKLDQVVHRHEELQAILSGGGLDSTKFTQASKEYAELGPLVEKVRELRAAQKEAQDLAGMLADSATDAEMKALAEEEFRAAKERVPQLERSVQLMLLPRDEADARNAILEVRAGTGGEEAALFAGDLFRMYQRYAALRESSHGASARGATARHDGHWQDVFARLKFRSGVHRVQRDRPNRRPIRTWQPPSRARLKRSTSRSRPDLHDVFRSSGPGGPVGQHHRRRRAHPHLPTVVVSQQDEEPAQEQGQGDEDPARGSTRRSAKLHDRRAACVRARSAAIAASGSALQLPRAAAHPPHQPDAVQLDKVMDGTALDKIVRRAVADDEAAQQRVRGARRPAPVKLCAACGVTFDGATAILPRLPPICRWASCGAAGSGGDHQAV